MIAKIYSCTTIGLDTVLIEVEVDVSNQGLPSFSVVGLPDKSVEEAKERVKSAIKNSGFDFPSHRIVVNLAPAEIPKEGSIFDFPIAVGILLAHGQIEYDFSDAILIGELSLDGSLRDTPGILPVSLFAQKNKFQKLFLPEVNASEAAIIPFKNIFPIKSLKEVCELSTGEKNLLPYRHVEKAKKTMQKYDYDLYDIRGQEFAKRALEICAAGGHNILFKGPPGSGKTLLAKTLPSILPDMTIEESLEATKIYSICGLLKKDHPIIKIRPFRFPHHTTSHIGLTGGGQKLRPGEISLAHRGVLFLDEIAEFPRASIEVLRQPLEDGYISITRAKGSLCFPAQFILVLATNPCPCGYFGDQKHHCVCTSSQILHYQKKISGPLLDRIDLCVDVPSVDIEKLTAVNYEQENSQTVRLRVQKARDLQKSRLKNENLVCNSELNGRLLKKYCQLKNEGIYLLKNAVYKLGLSARSYQKVIKVARTIADLAQSYEVETVHLSEALQYRQKNNT